mmetsp:Transcript_19426/g.61896  ORF Transcript_19426/g.61896 Transcript_19426/m.61896 type:complete len:342 (-) Transcript_19426:155-1180(-)
MPAARWTPSEGEPLLAQFQATARGNVGTKWYSGKATKIHADSTVDVLYDNGDTEQRVHPKFVKPSKAIPASAPPTPVSTPPTPVPPARAGLSEYELQREKNIADNKAALAALGLGDDSPRLIGPRVHQLRQTARKPRRESGPPQRVHPSRSRSAPDRLSAGLELEDVEAVERSARKKRQRRVFREEGGDAAFPRTEILVAESRWTLPALPGGGRHNSSCHLCTQGVASWRGAFSGPLGCSQCPLIWCSRCLTNIYEECHDDAATGDNLLVHRVIERANEAAAFVCPMCTSTCPCLRAGCGSKIEKHKSAGWVGVTGRRDALCRTPLVKRLKDDEALASLVA